MFAVLGHDTKAGDILSATVSPGAATTSERNAGKQRIEHFWAKNSSSVL